MTTAILTVNPGNLSQTLPIESTLTPTNSTLIPGQPALIPGAATTATAAAGIPQGSEPAKQVLEGRFLERLLLNPQSIPEGEQRLLRQQLQQHLLSRQATDPQAARDQLISTVLAGADGQPLINPQLLAQLEHKQAAAVAHQPYQPVVMPSLGKERPAASSPPNNSASAPRPIGVQQLAKAIEQALTGDSHSLLAAADAAVSGCQPPGGAARATPTVGLGDATVR